MSAYENVKLQSLYMGVKTGFQTRQPEVELSAYKCLLRELRLYNVRYFLKLVLKFFHLLYLPTLNYDKLSHSV